MLMIKRLRVHKLSLLNNNSIYNITTFERKILEIKSNLEEDKKWATSKESSSIIKLGLEPNSIINCNNIHEYINSRGFFGDVLLKSSSLSLSSSSSPSFRFMTALLTFPLTLSYVLNNINININNTKNINVLVLGARSESSLPFYWWKVMIIINIIILYYY